MDNLRFGLVVSTVAWLVLFGSGSSLADAGDQLPHISKPGAREAQLAALARVEAEVQELLATPNHEAMLEATAWLRKLSMTSIYQVEEREAVFARVQQQVLAVPGHAEAIATHIRARRDEMIQETNPVFRSSKLAFLRSQLRWDFERLGVLPSLETVGVLAGFLDETYTYTEVVGGVNEPLRDGEMVQGSFAGLARTTLRKLIANYPGHYREEPRDVPNEEWIAWREEIKAGKTTFRFKGSEQRYNFEGPVEAPSSRRPHPGYRVESGSRNASAGNGVVADTSQPATRHTKVIALIVGAGILAAAIGIACCLRFHRRAN